MKNTDDVITLPTSNGPAEARREAGKGADAQPWQIGYPWGDDRFYGTRAEVTARMKANIAEHDQEDA